MRLRPTQLTITSARANLISRRRGYPPLVPELLQVRPELELVVQADQIRGVAVQAAFESKGLKTGDHFIGRVKGQAQGLRPGGFKLRVNCVQRVQPRRGPAPRA
jgi:hypothetical protein